MTNYAQNVTKNDGPVDRVVPVTSRALGPDGRKRIEEFLGNSKLSFKVQHWMYNSNNHPANN